jgi:hypothetical protein
MANTTLKIGFLLLVALAAGCVTMRTGTGAAVSGANSVQFSWTGSGSVCGSMAAAFGNGETFTGRFFQTTSSMTDELGPQGPMWHEEGRYDVGPQLQYVAHYTGRVVAYLSRSDGAQMRCRFTLLRPFDGMAGGAHGECQLPNGLSADARFPPD